MEAVTQEVEGAVRRLRGRVKIETTEMMLRADEIDFDTETNEAEARGNVLFQHFIGGERIEADRVEYNLEHETGKYYNVHGQTPAKIEARPGVLTTSSPFSFEAKWAERIKDRYVLHEGFITNCKLPKPWWVLRGRTFDVIPGDRAVARQTVFWLKKFPLFYTPYFYKALDRAPRKSGFLTPNLGNSSRRGFMVGTGYYWAINRSYDATYRTQLFTQRGFAHHVDVRGKPNQTTDFNFILYGVNDRGRLLEDGGRGSPEGGYLTSFTGNSELPLGFTARADVNYLSSFQFRQAFTEDFFEAIFTEVHSIGFAAKHWSSFGLNLVAARTENFQSADVNNKVSIQKLPSIEFNSRDRQINKKVLPVWISLDASAGLLRRNQLLYQTRQFVERFDFEPRVMTALRWKDFHLIPSFSIRETNYGSTFEAATLQSTDRPEVQGSGTLRNSREFNLEFVTPSLARVYDAPGWMGQKLKHVIETRAGFRYVAGVDNFNALVRFDENELLSNTQEADISISNRLYAKRKDGRVEEVLSWQVSHRRFFDPTFGGAVQPDRRNVVLSSANLSGYTFFDGPRRYSPIVSTLRLSPRPGLGVEWRADYDPLRGNVVNSGLTADGRFSHYFISFGHNLVKSIPLSSPDPDNPRFLSPPANQFRSLVGIGQENRRGWSAAFSAIYDFRQGVMQFATTQVTYNTDCCGYSVQYRRFSFGTRNENQFRVAFAIANIGSFGTLKRQERIF